MSDKYPFDESPAQLRHELRAFNQAFEVASEFGPLDKRAAILLWHSATGYAMGRQREPCKGLRLLTQ